MTDIVERLHAAVEEDEPPRRALLVSAASEIARLRLLPEERCAIERAASFLEGSGWSGVTLRAILGRLSEPAAKEVIPLAAEMPEPYEIDGDS